jgi:hypothetical protein
MKLVVTQLVMYPKQYQYTAGHANGETEDIDE